MAFDFLVALGTGIGYNVTTPLPASPTYTMMALVTEIDGLSTSVEDIEGGLLSSRATPSRPGAIKYERMTLTMQFDPNDMNGLAFIQTQLTKTGGPDTINWQIVWEDGSKTPFRGYLGGLAYKGMSRDGRLVYDVPLKVTSFPATTPST